LNEIKSNHFQNHNQSFLYLYLYMPDAFNEVRKILYYYIYQRESLDFPFHYSKFSHFICIFLLGSSELSQKNVKNRNFFCITPITYFNKCFEFCNFLKEEFLFAYNYGSINVLYFIPIPTQIFIALI
jgi:hypothetical protein